MNSTLLFISIKVAFIALLLFVFAGVALRVANATTRVDTVTHVRDGDTIEVRTVRGRSMVVRLLGVDTPEMKGHCRRERALAREAKAFVVDALQRAETITLRRIRRTPDRYGRTLAYVYVDGADLSRALIAAKLGRTYGGGRRDGWC